MAELTTGEVREPQRLDSILGELQDLAADRDAVIYNICFRNAGVGIQWWEEGRVKTPEAMYNRGENLMSFGRRRSEALNRCAQEGKVIYRYYPDIRECFEAELARLRES